MGTGYTRQSAANIIDDAIIEAVDLNAEFNLLENAFNSATGHSHDGTTGEGPKIILTAAANVSGTLPIANGGTGATTASAAATALGLGTGDSPQFAAVNIGHATDTTITRTGAGAIAVEGVGVALNSISLTHTANTIELGHATDTTLSRASAGVLAVEGAAVPTVSANNTFTGDNTFTTTAGGGVPIEIISTNAGVSGPALSLYHNSATPANSDVVGTLIFYGNDNGAAKQEYGSITVDVSDVTAASEDANMNFYIPVAGSRTAVGTFSSSGLSLGTSRGLTTGTIELGDASDTTISRSSAGVIAVEGGIVPLENRQNTFTQDQFITDGSMNITATSANALLNMQSSGGSGRNWSLISETSGGFLFYDNTSALTRFEIDTSSNVYINSNDAGAGSGPYLILNRDSASPAASDPLGGILFRGRDSGGNLIDYGQIQASIIDPTNGSEDSTIIFYNYAAGAYNPALQLYADGTIINGSYTRFNYSENGASTGPILYLDRASASPAAYDNLGGIMFRGRDSAANETEYAQIRAGIIDPTNGSEDGSLYFSVVNAGVFNDVMSINNDGNTSITTSNDSGAGAGPGLSLIRLSASPAASDAIGYLDFGGYDSATNYTVYSRIGGVIEDPTNGSEDSAIYMYINEAGTSREIAYLNGTGLKITSTNAGATAGPVIDLYRDSASPANDDFIGQIKFSGENSVGTKIDYAQIVGSTWNVSNTYHGADIWLQTAISPSGSMITNRHHGWFTGSYGDTGNIAYTYAGQYGHGPYADGYQFKTSNGTPDSPSVVTNGHELGYVGFYGYDGAAYKPAAVIYGHVDNTPGSNDMPGRLTFYTTADGAGSYTERMRISSYGGVFIGTTDTSVYGNTTSTGAGVVIGQDATSEYKGIVQMHAHGTTPLYVNRTSDDGNLVAFFQDGTAEGSISVAGTTVSFNGGHLSRWTQWDGIPPLSQPRGTVMSNSDAMCQWFDAVYTVIVPEQPERLDKDGQVMQAYQPESLITKRQPYFGNVPAGGTDIITVNGIEYTADIVLCANDQLNKMVISDTIGDKNVAGVLERYDEDGEPVVAQSGDFVIRIASGVVVNRGDLLESNGDGCARPQVDDLVRSSTIAKVSSTYVAQTYADGSYLVPCVLMCGG